MRKLASPPTGEGKEKRAAGAILAIDKREKGKWRYIVRGKEKEKSRRSAFGREEGG